MSEPSVAVFVMAQEGHFRRLLPLIRGLAERGLGVHVFTDRRFAPEVERAGATFVDLFEDRSVEGADGASHPAPCRFVSFAARYADDVVGELRDLEPSLVVYDTHAVVGRVVAIALDVPYVNVCSGHNAAPPDLEALIETLPRVHVSPECERAVDVLRERYGLDDASPFSFVSGLSPSLNVYCEPEAYLTDAERRVFEPLAFHGSLADPGEIRAGDDGDRPRFGDGDGEWKVYVCFGTVVWRYWPQEALAALRSISQALAGMAETRGLISLGGPEIEPGLARALEQPNVAVAPYVDQWQALEEADVFVTHHGLSSTHEAIFNRVPMISYPFLWDQPGLASKCQGFETAIPLTASMREPVSVTAVEEALAQVSNRRDSLAAGLDRARDWELDAIAGRDSVLDRIGDLVGA